MFRFHSIALALLLMFASAAWAAPAVICNDDQGPIWLTYITKDGAAYRAHGWYRMDAGQCAQATGAEAAGADGQPIWVYGQNAAGDEAFSGTHGFCITNEKMDNAEVKFLGTGTMINYVPPGVGLKPCGDPRRVGVFAEIAAKDLEGKVVSANCSVCTVGKPLRGVDSVNSAKKLGEGGLNAAERGRK
jgi:uncharacterized membrane protein